MTKNYKIDDNAMVIQANVSKLTKDERADIEFLCKTSGYIVKNIVKRNSPTKKREYYKSKLFHADYIEFEKIASKPKSYSKACAFANRLIKLGELADRDQQAKADLEFFRIAYQENPEEALIWLKNWSNGQLAKEKAAIEQERLTPMFS